MNLEMLIDSLLIGFEILGILFIITYLKGKIESSITWFLVVAGITIGLMIYFMRHTI